MVILDGKATADTIKGEIALQVEEVIRKVERVGHSVVPVIDRKSKVYGIYVHNPDEPLILPPHASITKAMYALSSKPEKNTVYRMPDNAKEEDIRKFLKNHQKKFVPVINSEGILQKIAFLQKFDTNYIGMAIRTRKGYEQDLEKWGSQVDVFAIDSSNACFDNAIAILKYAKKKYPEKPFGIGNIIQAKHFTIFADAGADFLIAGMGVGAACKTGAERGNGRGQMTVAIELAQARDEYYSKKGRYVPYVLDGGIETVKDMTVALAFADFIMMGNYFNSFFEAAAQKFDANKKPTSTEELIKYVESWGEGHPRARLVAMYGMNFQKVEAKQEEANERYGHSTLSGSTVEGVVGLVKYKGRLKPNVEKNARYIRTTMSNSGATDLKSFRELAIVEKPSAETLVDMLPHDVEITEE